jgi:hypothetical protein
VPLVYAEVEDGVISADLFYTSSASEGVRFKFASTAHPSDSHDYRGKMSDNTYTAAPTALEQAASPTIALYSPMQASIGACLGGPVGLIYFLYRNFEALGKKSEARTTLILGAVLIVALWVILPILPQKMSGVPFTVAYIVTARQVAEKYQLTKQAIVSSTQYTFRSNWGVFGMGLLCLLGSVVLIIGPYMVLFALGVLK